jgi:anti-sigma B factor antagonist
MAVFSIDVSEHGQRCELSASGEVDLDVANQLAAMGLLSLNNTDATTLVIDLAKVTFMDSTGLGALVTIRNASDKLSKDLSLRGVPERVRKLLTVTGLDKAFIIDAGDGGRPTEPARQSA